MTQDNILSIITEAVYTIVIVAAPPLLMGLTVGVVVSIFQAVTSIQEATLAFVPKILAVMLSLIVFGPFMITTLEEYMIRLYSSIPQMVIPM